MRLSLRWEAAQRKVESSRKRKNKKMKERIISPLISTF